MSESQEHSESQNSAELLEQAASLNASLDALRAELSEKYEGLDKLRSELALKYKGLDEKNSDQVRELNLQIQDILKQQQNLTEQAIKLNKENNLKGDNSLRTWSK